MISLYLFAYLFYLFFQGSSCAEETNLETLSAFSQVFFFLVKWSFNLLKKILLDVFSFFFSFVFVFCSTLKILEKDMKRGIIFGKSYKE